MPFALESVADDRRFTLAGRDTLIVGRDPVSDLPIFDPAVSRRHAALQIDDREAIVRVTDLGSRNGTWINQARVTHGVLHPGDRIAFGTVAFTLCAPAPAPAGTVQVPPQTDPGATLRRERLVPSPDEVLADVAREAKGDGQATRRLTQLVRIAQRLGALGELDGLLDAIAADLFDTFDADRVAILLMATDGRLETRVSRDRHGSIPRPVPRAIAHGVAERQVALLTNDAGRDERTAGESVLQQAVKSAMAAPLLGEHRTTIGVLYVDHLRDRAVFDDDDLALLVAFAGIAAAAVERETAAERLVRAARVRENFERYFTPQLAERIAATTQEVKPGGTRLPVVVLFSDIRGFTAIAESLPPMQMANQLNEYFSAMVECVFRHGGALDKFIGDALMAYWGAPEARDDDTARALAAAFDMQASLAALNARWRAEDRPELRAGIGIHRGEAFVGNIGSPRRLEFTLIGDTVNTANRLCDLAEGGEVLVSDAVVDVVTRTRAVPMRCRSRDDLRVERRTAAAGRVWQVEPGS